MSAGDRPADREPLDLLADEYVARLRRGERPPLGEYVEGYPDLAGEIRDLFPALLMMEQLKPAAGDPSPDRRDGRSPARESPPVERLGEFRLLRVLGRGGMGVVYEAIQESLGRHVALKVLPPHGRLDATQFGRFRREARAAAGLHHSNIVPVFAVGEQDGVPYYAMQFIRGQSIDAILDDLRRLRREESSWVNGPRRAPGRGGGRRSQAPPATAGGGEMDERAMTEVITRGILGGQFATPPRLEPDRTDEIEVSASASTVTAVAGGTAAGAGGGRIADAEQAESSSLITRPGVPYIRTVARLGAQVADALAYAHAQGICHRDIKPSNLLLDISGTVWVADFGLAKSEGGDGDGPTQTGDVVGTLRYMAPERFNGRADARSDVYALGVTLYEMLTLRPAFGEPDRLKLIERISKGSVPGPRSIDPMIPGDLETVVLKAMAREPRERYASARALAEDLRRFLDDRTILARRSTAGERAWRWCRRNPALASLNAVAASLTVLVAVVSTAAALSYRGQLERTTKAERRARVALGASLLAEGAALQRTGLVGQRFESLDRLTRAAVELRQDEGGRLPEIRDHATAALSLTDLSVRWRRAIGVKVSIACDAPFERYAVSEQRGEVIVRGLDDDRELLRVPHPGTSFSGTEHEFSPDGRHLQICYQSSPTAFFTDVWHIDRRERVARQPALSFAHAFLPDSSGFLFVSPGNELVVWDLVGRRELRRLPLAFVARRICPDPLGGRVALSVEVGPPRVQIVDVDTGRELASWTDQVGHTAMSWSHDGRLLSVGAWDGRVFVWDMGRGRLASVLQGHPNSVIFSQFAPGGHLLATEGWDGTMRLWDADTGEELVSSEPGLRMFSPDGRRIATYSGDTLGVLDVAHNQEVRTFNPGLIGNRSDAAREQVAAAQFSPDGRLLALAQGDGVYLYDGQGARELARLKAGICETILFDEGGRGLITCGNLGLFRWPIGPEPGGGSGALQIGPPELLREATAGGEWYRASWLPDHRTLAMIDNAQARVLLVDTAHPHPGRAPDRELSSEGNHRLTSIAISPDGRWAAAGGWNGAGISLWDLPTRRRVPVPPHTFSSGDSSNRVAFSPDGRWLVSCTNNSAMCGHDFWEVGTWKRGAAVTASKDSAFSAPVFSPDGRMIAMGVSRRQVRLADAETGRAIADLPTLRPVGATPLTFSPDGTRLIVSTDRQTALMWDLRRIRGQLGTMGLDWDRPVFPPPSEAPGGPPAPPQSVRVIGEVLEPSARRARELAELAERLRSRPDDADALIDRGWLRLKAADWRGAIDDLEHLIRVRPDDPEAGRILGQAYLDTGNLGGALAAFSRELGRAPADRDLRLHRGLLALALGQSERAAEDFGRVLDADPTLDLARLNRARALIRSGRHRESLADLDDLIARNPGDFAPYQSRGIAHEALGDREQARRDRERAVSLLPESPDVLNNRAWALATGPFARRDPDCAVALARRAVALAPDRASIWNTLGVALYRAGEYGESVDSLERSLVSGEFAGYDLFFLAIARIRLGQPARARACFDRAVHWSDAQKSMSPRDLRELAAFRVEAEGVLAGSGDELPTDVFAPR